jgi:TldD protein
MLSKEDLEQILQEALKTGGEFAEVFLEESNATSIICEDNKIERITSGTDAGAGIRIIQGKETYYGATTDVNLASLKKLAKSVSSSLKEPRRSVAGSADLVPTTSSLPYPIKRRPSEVPIDEKVGIVELANKTARSLGDRVKQVMARYADTNQAVTIANSEGTYIEDQRIRTRFFINVIAARDGIIQTGYEAPGGSMGFELFEKHAPEKLAGMAGERAIMMLEAPHAPGGEMPVVMSTEAGGTMIHEACGHGLEADFIMKGTSIYGIQTGKKVASDLITVIDDSTMEGKFGAYRFDDEGTPSKKNILIENGILKGFMSDRFTAKALGIAPSGNGRRQSFRNKPVPRMTNTYIARGKSDPNEIISSIKHGLLVKRMGGGEVNVTNGDFVFEVTEGYLIEDGKVKHPVRGAILTGNGPKVLETIDMVGSDLTFQTGVCGKYDHAPVSDGQPTIRIPKIIVGGK